jgi:hypothetical protein
MLVGRDDRWVRQYLRPRDQPCRLSFWPSRWRRIQILVSNTCLGKIRSAERGTSSEEGVAILSRSSSAHHRWIRKNTSQVGGGVAYRSVSLSVRYARVHLRHGPLAVPTLRDMQSSACPGDHLESTLHQSPMQTHDDVQYHPGACSSFGWHTRCHPRALDSGHRR